MVYTFKHTVKACYIGYITQAIVNNLAPLLFVIFQDNYALTFEQVGRLILVNFGVQLIADLFSVRYLDRIGYRRAAVLAHILCVTGLFLLALLPGLLPQPYVGLTLAIVVYALGGGLLEVLVSPIVEALPGEAKESAMSMLHSFYCWGQVGVVLFTTLLLRVFGSMSWPGIVCLWACVPLCNLFLFRKVPLAPAVEEHKLMKMGELFRSKFFIAALVLMLCAGASELAMSQWSSLFAERGLGVPKMLGDLLGPCLFAVCMGTGRVLYGVYGRIINLKNAMIFCGLLCIACYLVSVFAPWPMLSLLGCALCGFSVSLMWPGTFSLSAATFPRGGTALFGMLAVFGDLGAAFGPWMAGVVADQTGRLQSGLLAASFFPLVLLGGVLFFKFGKKEKI